MRVNFTLPQLLQRWKKRGPRGPWSRNLFPGFPQILWLYMRKVKKFTKMNVIADYSVHKRGNFIVFVDYMSKQWICVNFFVLNWLTYINLGLFATNIICTFSAKKSDSNQVPQSFSLFQVWTPVQELYLFKDNAILIAFLPNSSPECQAHLAKSVWIFMSDSIGSVDDIYIYYIAVGRQGIIFENSNWVESKSSSSTFRIARTFFLSNNFPDPGESTN